MAFPGYSRRVLRFELNLSTHTFQLAMNDFAWRMVMTNTNTLEKPKKKTGGFASRLLGKQLEERTKKSTFEFAKPALQSSSKENGETEKLVSSR